MKFKEVALSDASTEAKVAGLALLLDKELLRLSELVLNTKKLQGPKGDQGLQGPKGEQGDRGFDGTNGKDGVDGAQGPRGDDGRDGVGVQDAHIDFDGSLVITLTDGREINAGDVVPMDVAEKIKVIGNGGGTSQGVLDAIDAINAVIATYGTMALQDDTAVDINGGAIDGTAIGAAAPASGVFTTLTATGQALLGNSMVQVTPKGTNLGLFEFGPGSYSQEGYLGYTNSSTYAALRFNVKPSTGGAAFSFNTYGSAASAGSPQFLVNHTASAVNYVQVTGAATGSDPVISAQGSDANIRMIYRSKGGSYGHRFQDGLGNNQFVVVTSGANAVNYWQSQTNVANNSPAFSVQGSDTNISAVFQSKGTGAIDLAAGSRGVNISNGGTVTAITRTAIGGSYTSAPTIAISAPTTAGGVQATATCTLIPTNNPSIVSGGTGYTVGNVLTFVGGTGTAQQMTVTAVAAGVITAASSANTPAYSVAPSNNISVTGGTGTGATFSVASWCIGSTFTITNAGSGYVEQPTVTFSGGGGSGAAAYAIVGSVSTVKGLGGNGGASLLFTTAGGPAFSVSDSGRTTVDYWEAIGSTGSVALRVAGSTTNNNGIFTSKGTGYISLQTNAFGSEALRASHTASAVNYVQVTGAATGSRVALSAQGSDTNIGFAYNTKGAQNHIFQTNSSNLQFVVANRASSANWAQVQGAVAGSSPAFMVDGSDTNIDLTLTPKGTGLVRFGIYTAGAPAATGYISIKAADGTTYKLLVST